MRGQIVEVIQRYVEGGPKPNSIWKPGTLTVHPGMEHVLERLMNPYSLAREDP